MAALKLKKPESVKKFAKRMRATFMSQEAAQRIAASSLNRLLVDKGLVTKLELQQAFIDEAERQGYFL